MILVDTGPLVALVDPRDSLHKRSRNDLAKLAGAPFLVTVPVLTETYFHLQLGIARRKLRALLEQLRFSIREITEATIAASMDWLDVYGDQDPDFADAVTAVLASEIRRCRV